MCGWCMSSQAPCPAASLTSPTAAETTAANSRSRASGRNTAWEHQWQELATRLSGMTMSLNCTSSCLENKNPQKGLNRITPAALLKTIIFPLLPTRAVKKKTTPWHKPDLYSAAINLMDKKWLCSLEKCFLWDLEHLAVCQSARLCQNYQDKFQRKLSNLYSWFKEPFFFFSWRGSRGRHQEKEWIDKIIPTSNQKK